MHRRTGITRTQSGIVVVVAILLVVGGYVVETKSGTGSAAVTSTSIAGSSVPLSTAGSTITSSTASTSSPSATTQIATSSSTSSNGSPLVLPPPNTAVNSVSTVRIGYYANLNHAQAIIGISDGDFQRFLGNSTTIQTTLFTSGSPEMTALLAGKIDIAYVGPSPAVDAFIQSNGTALRILSGVANGGAVFVVRNDSGITSVKDLGGKKFAAPGVGNTQDIALRHYLLVNGYKTTDQGGNVTVVDTSNSNIVTLMATGQIDGAWVPEPWGATLIAQADAHIFVNEESLWPNGQFSTTELVVSTSFLNAHPDVVKEIVAANLYETRWIQANPQQAAVVLNTQLQNLTGTPVGLPIVQNALTRLSFTYDPLESSVLQQALNAYQLNDLGSTAPTASNLSNLYDLSILNSLLQSQDLPTVGGPQQ